MTPGSLGGRRASCRLPKRDRMCGAIIQAAGAETITLRPITKGMSCTAHAVRGVASTKTTPKPKNTAWTIMNMSAAI